jgi:hypothetical protein
VAVCEGAEPAVPAFPSNGAAVALIAGMLLTAAFLALRTLRPV